LFDLRDHLLAQIIWLINYLHYKFSMKFSVSLIPPGNNVNPIFPTIELQLLFHIQ
jgi:hypothetical protein